MSATKTIELNKEKILSQMVRLPEIAKKDGWLFNYDSDSDELTFGKEVMPKDSFLFNVNEEIDLFLTPDSNVRGIFIEYFGDNYVKHNEGSEIALATISATKKKTSKKGMSGDKFILEGLENKLALEAVESLFGRGKLFTAI